MLLIRTLNLGGKLILRIKKEKIHAKTCPYKSNYNVVTVAESSFEIEDKTVCDKEVNILMTNEYEIMISEMETNAIIDTACTERVSGEKCFFSFIKCLDDTALNKKSSSHS